MTKYEYNNIKYLNEKIKDIIAHDKAKEKKKLPIPSAALCESVDELIELGMISIDKGKQSIAARQQLLDFAKVLAGPKPDIAVKYEMEKMEEQIKDMKNALESDKKALDVFSRLSVSIECKKKSKKK